MSKLGAKKKRSVRESEIRRGAAKFIRPITLGPHMAVAAERRARAAKNSLWRIGFWAFAAFIAAGCAGAGSVWLYHWALHR
jgi:hypothetical protein